jgi:ATP-grasp domain, R2K clade family 3
MLFLFPSDYFNFKLVDKLYRSELQSLQTAGFATATISIDSLDPRSPKVHPAIDPQTEVIYRGWMLTPNDYGLLIDSIEYVGAKAYTSPAMYLSTHYLPNWYRLLADFTLGWERFFIKDYVKSLKTSVGAIVSSPAEVSTVIIEMQKFRGSIEGGICVRRVEDFIPTTERRYFIINGKSFAADRATRIPDIVTECARIIESKFFSIDIIERRDGVLRVVEIGDGQVSGLVGWTPERFAEIWVDSLNRH